MTKVHTISFEHTVSCELSSGPATVSMRIVAPAELVPGRTTPVLFAFPGGGYTKAYFDLQPPGGGYSMARYLADRGIVVVACDNLGTGESTRPIPASSLILDDVVDADQAVVESVLAALRAGTLPQLAGPIDPIPVGLGHSMGAGLVTVHQARRAPYAGVVLMGRALSGSPIPAPPAPGTSEGRWLPGSEQHADFEASAELVDGYYLHRHHTAWQRYLFFWDDTPEQLIEYDEGMATVFPLDLARELSSPGGPNERSAGQITSPVLVVFGERDLTNDPFGELGKYPGSSDIRLLRVARSAHCHNMSSSREWMWRRIADWTHEIAGQSGS